MHQLRLLKDALDLYHRDRKNQTQLRQLQRFMIEVEEQAQQQQWPEIQSPDVGTPPAGP